LVPIERDISEDIISYHGKGMMNVSPEPGLESLSKLYKPGNVKNEVV
jgi:hypothetical protein